MEQKAKTRALLAAFGCALAYLLAGKALAFLPAPAWDVRALSFVYHCIAAPVVEELVFRGAIQQLAQPLGRWQRPGAGRGRKLPHMVERSRRSARPVAFGGFGEGLRHPRHTGEFCG